MEAGEGGAGGALGNLPEEPDAALLFTLRLKAIQDLNLSRNIPPVCGPTQLGGKQGGWNGLSIPRAPQTDHSYTENV